MRYHLVITAFVITAMATQAMAQAPNPNPLNVYYLDSANGNFLFRGGMPISSTPGISDVHAREFIYQQLLAGLQYAAGAATPKVTLPKRFYVADISLVQLQNGNPGDTQNLEIEYQYWKAHMDWGRFVYWETDGYVIDPPCTQLFPPNAPAGFREYLVHTLPAWFPDKLTFRVDQLHTWLTNGMPGETRLPVVLYIHCDGGCDRTGELSGAYAMKYLKKSWHEVNNMNFAAGCWGKRPFGCGNFIAAHWYCFWLAETTGRKDLGCDSNESCTGAPQPPACPPQGFGT